MYSSLPVTLKSSLSITGCSCKEKLFGFFFFVVFENDKKKKILLGQKSKKNEIDEIAFIGLPGATVV